MLRHAKTLRLCLDERMRCSNDIGQLNEAQFDGLSSSSSKIACLTWRLYFNDCSGAMDIVLEQLLCTTLRTSITFEIAQHVRTPKKTSSRSGLQNSFPDKTENCKHSIFQFSKGAFDRHEFHCFLTISSAFSKYCFP
jgi:hypothetical protein